MNGKFAVAALEINFHTIFERSTRFLRISTKNLTISHKN